MILITVMMTIVNGLGHFKFFLKIQITNKKRYARLPEQSIYYMMMINQLKLSNFIKLMNNISDNNILEDLLVRKLKIKQILLSRIIINGNTEL